MCYMDRGVWFINGSQLKSLFIVFCLCLITCSNLSNARQIGGCWWSQKTHRYEQSAPHVHLYFKTMLCTCTIAQEIRQGKKPECFNLAQAKIKVAFWPCETTTKNTRSSKYIFGRWLSVTQLILKHLVKHSCFYPLQTGGLFPFFLFLSFPMVT